MPSPQLVVVVPCYNEAKRLDQSKFVEFVARHPEVDFLFVNDGSTDETLTVLQELHRSHPHRLWVHDLEQNVGKAEAVRQGILAALQRKADWVGFLDADLATPLEAIPQFRRVFLQIPNVQVVVGSRVALLGRRIERRYKRHLIGRAFATVVSWMLRLKVYDTQCGAKFFRTSDVMREVFAEPFLSKWIFDVEIFARLIQQEKLGELPPVSDIVYERPLDEWREVEGSKLKMKDFATALFDLLSIYRTYVVHGGQDVTPKILPVNGASQYNAETATISDASGSEVPSNEERKAA